MFRGLVHTVVLVVLLPVAQAMDAQEILQQADQFRLPLSSAKVVTEVELYKDGVLDKQRRYHVFMKPGQRSLVQFKSPIERGQKVLMVREKFWLLMPKSRRPIRITPVQKLLGEAATGDVATMTWSEYYRGEVVSESVEKAGVDAIHLNLVGQSKAATYARIELWVERNGYAPIAADLFVQSGKLAKQVRYRLEEQDGARRVVEMELLDRIRKSRRTVVKTLAVEPAALADKYYNPQYLARNPKLEF